MIASSFEFTGNQGSGEISLKNDVILPSQVEARYYVGLKASTNNDDYVKSAPINLNNNDKVFIKFFVKEEYKTTHQLSSDFVNKAKEIIVSGLINNKI